MKIGILGDGAMATAIQHILKHNQIEPQVFSRKNGNIDHLQSVDYLFLCLPSSVIAEYVTEIKEEQTVISCAKGIAKNDKPFISSLFDKRYCVLSGPNFADEIVGSHKTITTLASRDTEILQKASSMLSSPLFEIEQTNEVIGVEICGIVKNVIAIMMGYASVQMRSWNEKSLIMTKAFQEVGQILQHFGCNKSILELSCGIGDIFLTCSSANSRNYRFGISLAEDKKIDGITVEGLRSVEFIESIPLPLPYLKMVSGILSNSKKTYL